MANTQGADLAALLADARVAARLEAQLLLTFGAHDTLDSLVRAINTDAAAAGVDVTLTIADSGRGLSATDSSGGSGTLTLSGDGATALGLAASSATNNIRGSDLERKYVGLATSLSSLAFGKGVGIGAFKITDSAGESATVDIGSDAVTIYDVMSEINSRGLLVEARLNDNGDGITLVDTNTGTPVNAMKVVDSSGSVARSLGILGTATTPGDDILGSFERMVDLDLTDRDTAELGAVSRALLRLRQGGFGVCEDCGADIPFQRLQVEPQAARCVACEAAAEGRMLPHG